MPAPPPKTNPWKKPVVEQAAPEKSLKPSSEAKTVDVTVVTEKLKPEKLAKVKPIIGEGKQQQQAVSKSNPWKKLEKSSKAVDEEDAGGEAGEGEGERKGEKGSSTWPTLALKPSKKKKEGEEACSVEEGKENQVGQLCLFSRWNSFTISYTPTILFRTPQTSITTTTSRVTTT